MSRYFRNCFLFTVLLTLVSAEFVRGQSDQEAASKLKINVRLFNYAQVSNPTMWKATGEATRIFQQAGVETVWSDHTPAWMVGKIPPVSSPRALCI